MYKLLFLLILSFFILQKINTHVCISPNKSSDICYNILKNTENMQVKAELMYELDKKIQVLQKYIFNKYPTHDITKKFMNRYKSVMHEAVPEIDSTTYTINKSEIFICLTSRDEKSELYDINTLLYVIIHELGHVCNDSIGHTNNFNETFAFLLKNAVDIGLYKYINYAKYPINYCGLVIDTNILDSY